MPWPFRGEAWPSRVGLAMVTVAAVAVAAVVWRKQAESPVLAELDVVYGRAGEVPLRLDVFRPREAKGPRPAVLMIHGGGWVRGSKELEHLLADHLARAGFVAVAVGYRLAVDDASRYPAQVDDVQRAVRWVRANAGRYGVDPSRIGAFGHSAGGHLAASLGTRETRDNTDPALAPFPSRVACVVDCAGPVDFTDDENPPLANGAMEFVSSLFGKSRSEVPEAYRDASPLAHVDARSAPTLIVHGTADDVVPVEQSRRFFRGLRASGVEARLVELEGEGHSFESPDNVRIWIGEMMGFLRAHLKP